MKRVNIGIVLTLLLVAGCSNNEGYGSASAEDIFNKACANCHHPKAGGHYFELDKEMANVDAVANKISQGNLVMPAFPNIQGDSLQSLSEYVLGKSKLE